MEALIGGWVAGYVMAMLTTGAVTYLVLRSREAALIERWVARDVSGPLLVIPILTGAVVAWTMFGLVLGATYEVASLDGEAGGLGSPSVAFTLGVVMLGIAPALLVGILWQRLWWMWTSFAIAFGALFGWLLPHLAGR